MTTSFLCPFTSKNDANTCDTIPNAEYKKEWHAGGTGYLDGVRPSDDVFNTSPVVKFIDQWNRSAITFKYTVSCPDHPEGNNGDYAVTFFQRYTGITHPWVSGGHFSHGSVQRLTTGGASNEVFSWYENLILNKQEKISIHNFSTDTNEQCTVTLAGLEQPVDSVKHVEEL